MYIDIIICITGVITTVSITYYRSPYHCYLLSVLYNKGDHVYAKLMRRVSSCPKLHRPRILGLTASPFPAPSTTIAMKNLREFRSAMNDAQIFKPNMPFSGASVEWIIAEETRDQKWAREVSFTQIKDCCIELSSILLAKSGEKGSQFSSPVSIDSGVLNRFRGKLLFNFYFKFYSKEIKENTIIYTISKQIITNLNLQI